MITSPPLYFSLSQTNQE